MVERTIVSGPVILMTGRQQAQGDLDRNIELRCVREFQPVRDGPIFVPETDEVFPTFSLRPSHPFGRPHIPGLPKG